MKLKHVTCALASLAFASRAFAHPGHGEHSLMAGLQHPLTGLDHILAMIAVGLWAAQIGGRAILVLPLAFLTLMLAGGAVALAGVGIPTSVDEHIIAASVVVLGLAIAVAARLPLWAAAILVGASAIFHGYAHIAEMSFDRDIAGYGVGFLLATAFLHAIGIGLGLLLNSRPSTKLVRFAGAGIATCGLLILIGWVGV